MHSYYTKPYFHSRGYGQDEAAGVYPVYGGGQPYLGYRTGNAGGGGRRIVEHNYGISGYLFRTGLDRDWDIRGDFGAEYVETEKKGMKKAGVCPAFFDSLTFINEIL